MNPVYNPYEKLTGSDRLKSPLLLLGLLGLIAAIAGAIGKAGMMGAFGLVALPLGFIYLYLLLRMPIIGLYTAVALGFVLLGLGRYMKGVQVGLAMDGMLILTYVALFFNKFHEKINWTPAKKDITVIAFIWFLYTVFQLLNPEAKSTAAWFSGRGVGMYMLLIVPLALILIDNQKKMDLFFYIWGILALIATLKGIVQLRVGLDPWEKAWLAEGNYKTHILFGNLRVFSFLSDAGQFGANQAYTGVVMTIVALAMKGWKKKLFFFTVGFIAFYGMIISGTRGSMVIPFAGLGLYFILRKNKLVMISGFLFVLVVFYFFKFTTIGQGNYQIRRMRTAFDPNDASLQVRLENQRRLKTYMADRPFGGGVGHGGVKAQRFLPTAFLSQIPTDSGYVLIWVELGIVGLLLHLLILFYIIITSSFRIMFRIRDPNLKLKMAALTSGMFGIMLANYGNAVLAQMPTSILIYTSIALMMNMNHFDSKGEEVPEKKPIVLTNP